MLAGHADAFRGPFAVSVHVPEADATYYVPGVVCGSVCVRREAWHVRADTLAAPLASTDPFTPALRLRDWVAEALRPDVAECYCTVASGARYAHKPLYVDLRNLLSVFNLRRFVLTARAVAWSPLVPRPTRMVPPGGEPHLTELMIEV